MKRKEKGSTSPKNSPHSSPKGKALKQNVSSDSLQDTSLNLVAYSPRSSSESSLDISLPQSPCSTVSDASVQFNILNLTAETTMSLKKINDTIEKYGLDHLRSESNEESRAVAEQIERYAKLTNITTSLEQPAKPNPYRAKLQPKRKYIPQIIGDLPGEEHFLKYLYIKFEDEEIRRKICPYSINDNIKEITGEDPKDIVSLGNTGYIVEMNSKASSNKLLKAEALLSFKCTVSDYEQYNYCKGLVYLEDLVKDDIKEYEKDLIEEFPFIKKIEVASFIKSRNPKSTPVLMYFRTPVPPLSLNIPGEPYITKVYNFQSRPLLCKNCYMYGHKLSKCKNKKICRNCCSLEHTEKTCTTGPVCLHCQEDHPSGSLVCVKHKEEMLISSTQDREKVTRQRARQIVSPIPEPPFFAPAYTSEFIVKIDSASEEPSTPTKKSTSVFQYYRQLSLLLKDKPEYFRRHSVNEFKTKVISESDSNKIVNINQLCGKKCTVIPNLKGITTKGIIYTAEFQKPDATSFIEGLKKNKRIADVSEATWIHPRVKTSRAFLISFYGNNTPSLLPVLGERSYCTVYPHFPTPQRCRNCQSYEHTIRDCSSGAICGKCSKEHDTRTCTSEEEKCKHCGGNHKVGAKNCKVHSYEKNISRIMYTRKLSRQGAITYIDKDKEVQRREESRTGFWLLSPPRPEKQPVNHGDTVPAIQATSTGTDKIVKAFDEEPISNEMEVVSDFMESASTPLTNSQEAIVHFYTQPSQETPQTNSAPNFDDTDLQLSTQEENIIHQQTQNISIPENISNIPLPTEQTEFGLFD